MDISGDKKDTLQAIISNSKIRTIPKYHQDLRTAGHLGIHKLLTEFVSHIGSGPLEMHIPM